MLSPIRVLVVAFVIASAPTLLAAQSLAEIAKKTADDRAALKAAEKKTGAVTPTKVITNQDLQTINAPAPADVAVLPAADALPGAVVAKPTPPTEAEIRDATQRRNLALAKAQGDLFDFQVALRKAEANQRDLQRSYDSQCLGRLETRRIVPCGEMRSTLRYELPDAITKVRAHIYKLAVFLGMDPELAVQASPR
jgi:hypothetical protein